MYVTQHIFIRFLEEWQEQLDHNKIVRTILLHLSDPFHCILHDLFINCQTKCLWFRQEHLNSNFFLI